MPKSSLPPDLQLTPIPISVDLKEMDASIRKIADAVNKSARHTERIPNMERKVEVAGTKVVELGVKMETMGERVTRVEDKIDKGHECVQVEIIGELKAGHREASQKIELDARQGVEHREKLERLSSASSLLVSEVEEIKKAPRRLFYGLLGAVLVVLSGAGGAVWFLAELSKDVEHERVQRADQFSRIERELKGISTVRVNTSEMKQGMIHLEKAVGRSSEQEVEYRRLCEDMTTGERRMMRRLLIKRGKRVPSSCGD